MNVSDKGLALVRAHEGCKLTAYPDPATGGEPWTIGYGHTGGVKQGDKITRAQADEYLRQDAVTAAGEVSRLVTSPLNQNQFDALVDFVFNLGAGALEGSTLLKRLNEGNYRAAADQFGRWVFANDVMMPGLVKRRAAEQELFTS